MHRTKHRIIEALRQCEHATVSELAQDIGVKDITIRHHLTSLRASGLVELDIQRQAVGRPRHIFSLTTAAQQLKSETK